MNVHWHYGRDGGGAACGVRTSRLTLIRSQVTCRGCRATVRFQTEDFTRNPTKLPKELTRTGRSRRHRQGARP